MKTSKAIFEITKMLLNKAVLLWCVTNSSCKKIKFPYYENAVIGYSVSSIQSEEKNFVRECIILLTIRK